MRKPGGLSSLWVLAISDPTGPIISTPRSCSDVLVHADVSMSFGHQGTVAWNILKRCESYSAGNDRTSLFWSASPGIWQCHASPVFQWPEDSFWCAVRCVMPPRERFFAKSDLAMVMGKITLERILENYMMCIDMSPFFLTNKIKNCSTRIFYSIWFVSAGTSLNSWDDVEAWLHLATSLPLGQQRIWLGRSSQRPRHNGP